MNTGAAWTARETAHTQGMGIGLGMMTFMPTAAAVRSAVPDSR